MTDQSDTEQPRRQLGAEDLDPAELARMYHMGRSIREIAREKKASYNTIRDRLAAAGVKFRPRGGTPTNIDRDEVINLCTAERLTAYQIARKLGVSEDRVRVILCRAGVLPPPPVVVRTAGTGSRSSPAHLHHVPEQVTYAREKAGLSKAALARLCGVSGALISEIEKGTRNATPAMVLKIAAACDCPPRVLLATHQPG